MKYYKTFITGLFLISCQLANAQTVDKGSMYVGLAGSWYRSDYFNQFGYLVAPRFEYINLRKIGTGIDLGYSKDEDNRYIISSIYSRYYLFNRKFSPIIEASYLHGFNLNGDNSIEEYRDLNVVFLNIGISTPRLIINRIGFDLTFGTTIYQSSYNDRLNYTLSGIRITYSLANK